ncbi:uncharacterized protein E0L32_002331 [Thyridium curvatum]|uniref:Transcription factor TFIIIC triple barrel domain-containing protein n=1 Tax=Thyridium curvatum TaxID=1093900 RepID=A0A507AD33_9PEZI|nr:uncharacterized protein E0L32_002331 [Thyridium curvatum]TPX06835.1 hypothetical protein E0L32_002331 [Thyridium curvatum]
MAESSDVASQPASAAPVTDGDDSDWEYEYSATETETYYLTLDLSIPDFLNRREDYIVHHTRGGFRTWVNPLLNPPAMQGANREMMEDEGDANDQTGGGSDNGENEMEREEDDEDNDNDSNDGQSTRKILNKGRRTGRNEAHAAREMEKPGPEEEDPTEIQILDLHSPDPLVSYRGRIFTGQWASNIGTEMLFTRHDSQSGLPALRQLRDDVDLLAASSARINFTPVDLRSHHGSHPDNRLHRTRETNGFLIQVHGDVRNQRRPQARFLEHLMAIKKRKAERDEVTVYATEGKQYERVGGGDGDDVAQEDDSLPVKLAKSRLRHRRQRAELHESALRAKKAQERLLQGTGRPKGRPRGGGRGRGGAAAAEATTLEGSGAGEQNVSTPTPGTWNELGEDDVGGFSAGDTDMVDV